MSVKRHPLTVVAIVLDYARSYMASSGSLPPLASLLRPLRGLPLMLRKRAIESLARVRKHSLRAEDFALVGKHWMGTCSTCGKVVYVTNEEVVGEDIASGPALNDDCTVTQ